MPKQKVKVKIKWYNTVTVSLGKVKIDLLEVASQYESEEVGSPIDVLLNIVERSSRKSEGDYFEVRVSDGIIEVMGESPKYNGRRSLFPYPVRVKRIGIVRFKDLQPAEQKEGEEPDVFVIDENKVKWRRFKKEYYIYEGKVEADEDTYLLIIDTEAGRRIVRVPSRQIILSSLRSSQPLPQRVEESHQNGRG